MAEDNLWKLRFMQLKAHIHDRVKNETNASYKRCFSSEAAYIAKLEKAETAAEIKRT